VVLNPQTDELQVEALVGPRFGPNF